MYTFRIWSHADLPWLDQAAAACAWEALAPEDKAGATPATVGGLGVQRIRQTIESPWGTAIVAQAGPELAGYIALAAAPDGVTEEVQGHLIDMWVAPHHRRRGVARRLKGLGEGILASMGLRKVKLWSGVHNLPALRMAVSMGYSPGGIIGEKSL